MKGYVYLPYLVIVGVCWVFFFLFMPETKNRTFDEVARDLAFGTIVVGRRTAALQAPVFTKDEDDGGNQAAGTQEGGVTAKPLLNKAEGGDKADAADANA